MADWKQMTEVRHRLERLWPGRKRTADEPASGMTMSAVKMTVPADMSLVTPTMRIAVVEDLCWAISRADWLARRPVRWRVRARRAWQAEKPALDDKQGRIAELVALAGKE